MFTTCREYFQHQRIRSWRILDHVSSCKGCDRTSATCSFKLPLLDKVVRGENISGSKQLLEGIIDAVHVIITDLSEDGMWFCDTAQLMIMSVSSASHVSIAWQFNHLKETLLLCKGKEAHKNNLHLVQLCMRMVCRLPPDFYTHSTTQTSRQKKQT